MTLQPDSVTVRSGVWRKLGKLGARFEALGHGGVAAEVPDGTVESLGRLGLVDLSPLPRTGFKGRGTIPAMQAAGVIVEAEPNRAFSQADGGLCAVLAPGEVLLLCGPHGDAALVRRLEAGWSIDEPRATYLVPRFSTHAWYRVTGELAPAMFATICGIDLRPKSFGQLDIAQTSVVRLTGIIIREDLAGTPAFHLLVHSASAEYVWDCLLDAMAEFGGKPAGLSTLLQLATSPP